MSSDYEHEPAAPRPPRGHDPADDFGGASRAGGKAVLIVGLSLLLFVALTVFASLLVADRMISTPEAIDRPGSMLADAVEQVPAAVERAIAEGRVDEPLAERLLEQFRLAIATDDYAEWIVMVDRISEDPAVSDAYVEARSYVRIGAGIAAAVGLASIIGLYFAHTRAHRAAINVAVVWIFFGVPALLLAIAAGPLFEARVLPWLLTVLPATFEGVNEVTAEERTIRAVAIVWIETHGSYLITPLVTFWTESLRNFAIGVASGGVAFLVVGFFARPKDLSSM